MTKLKATFEMTYDADPANYDTEDDPVAMAAMDEESFSECPDVLLEMLFESGEIKVTPA